MANKVPIIVHVLRVYYKIFGSLFPDLASNSLINLFSTPRKKVVRKQEEDVLAKAKQSTLLVGEEKLTVYEWGNGEKLAMLFHGWESNTGSLGNFIDPLLDRGYRIVAFDSPAHGKSEGKYANLIYFKKAAIKVIEAFGKPNLAIGHSLGADAIIMTAYEENLKFDKVILISPLNRLMKVFEEMQDLLYISPALLNRFIEKFEKAAGYEFKNFYFHDYGNKSPLENILLLHDVNDKVTDYSHSKEMAENWSKSILKSIEGSGHYRILWSEQTLKYTLDFID